MYLLSLPESEILPQEQSELCQETHYSLSWQYPANASLWQPVHLINPEGNKRQSLVLIQSSKVSWGVVGMVVSGTNHSLPPPPPHHHLSPPSSQWGGGAQSKSPVPGMTVTSRHQNGRIATSQHVSDSHGLLTADVELDLPNGLCTQLSGHWLCLHAELNQATLKTLLSHPSDFSPWPSLHAPEKTKLFRGPYTRGGL